MRQKKFFLRIFAACMVLLLTGCGKNKELYDSGRNGYTSITAVDGICFDVMSDVARNATAITNISEDMSFEQNQTYVFKDGGKRYFIFRMDSIVYVAEKGSSFGLRDAPDKLAALQNGNIMGIYFTSPRKKLDFVEDEKDGIYKLSATVTAQVAITSNLYNDFAGRFSYITDGTEEWAVFVGSRGEDFRELPDDTKEVITYMAATVAPCAPPTEEEEKPPAVSLGGNNETVSANSAGTADTEKSKEVSESAATDAQAENTKPTEEEKPETTAEPLSESDSNEESADISDMLPLEPVEVMEVEDIPSSEEPSGTEEEKKEEKEPDKKAEVEEKTADSLQKKPLVRANNQKEAKPAADGKIYTSDIYSMLALGKTAYATALLSEEPGYGNVEVCADRILTGKDAVNLIRKAFSDGTIYGEYFDAPEGCMWHAVHYTVAYPQNVDGYVNVKIRGMDGENLRFRGIAYSHRSYDIKISDGEYYAFYAVPNGCPEYVLEIGEGSADTVNDGLVAAYYRYQK